MTRKTPLERDLIDTRTLMSPGRSRERKIRDILALLAAHGLLEPEQLRGLLDAFGRSEWSRGFTAGVADATDDDA